MAGICSLLILALLFLAARAAQLSVDERGVRRGDDQTTTYLRLPPARGLVVDRHGAELAVSVNAPSVFAIPGEIQDPEATADTLARVLQEDAGSLAERLELPGHFVYLARWVSGEQADRVHGLGLPGIGVIEEPRRAYPHHELAAPLLGFANIDGEGVRGIEQLEDGWLRGHPRSWRVERDARGRLLGRAGVDPLDAAGGDVALTLDAALQSDAEAALRNALIETGSRMGLVISLDPRSGDVLALAEAPGFDPNHFRQLDYAQTRSRAFLDAFEPGSTLKAFLVAAALEEGAVRPEQWIDCGDGELRVPGKIIHDRKPFSLLDVTGVLRVSSNIGAAKIAFELGRSRYFEALRRFGFGEPTGVFPDESSGVLRPWRQWRPVDHANIAFGQGIAVTPVQLAAATAALANGGLWMRPRLVLARRRPDAAWKTLPEEAVRRVVSPETARRVLGMLEEVVGPGGTGRRAALPGVRVAGKTGTSQKFDPASGAYSEERTLAWFVGVAPADAPRLVVLAVLDEPTGASRSGGGVAAPLFARVAGAQLSRLDPAAFPPPAVLREAAKPARRLARSGDGAVRRPSTGASGSGRGTGVRFDADPEDG